MTKEKHDAEKIFNEFFIVGLRVDSSPIAESFNFAADIFVKVGNSKWKYSLYAWFSEDGWIE